MPSNTLPSNVLVASPVKMKALWFARISIIVLGVFLPSSSNGGSKSYDIGILLSQPHPFADSDISKPPKTDIDRPSDTKGSNAISIFGGWMTDNDWDEVFTPWDLEFRDTALIGIAGSRRIWRYDDDISFEIEGQIVRYVGDQDSWEFNLPIIARWETFPWNDVIDTSVAFGIGPSYATKVPKEEVAREGESQQWLVYWVVEVALGLPEADWSGILRLHHRSDAFGIVADDGSSNVLAVGLKRRF